MKHWAAIYRLTALKKAEALAAGPEDSRSWMVVNSQVVTVNTRPPTRASFSKNGKLA